MNARFAKTSTLTITVWTLDLRHSAICKESGARALKKYKNNRI